MTSAQPIAVSGFTFIRNAVKLDYPVVEAITSVLPLCDEFVVNVGRVDGDDDDGTLELVRSIGSPKIRILESTWNPHMTRGAFVYAQQTNIAMFNCRGRWAFYVQSDEVVHEEDHALLRRAMERYIDDPRVDAIALRQTTFWGDYSTQLAVRPWTGYRKCWIVKPHHFILSRGDAANFTVHPKYKERGRKVRAIATPARQFHYSEVKSLRNLEIKHATRRQFWTEKGLDLREFTREEYYRRFPRQFVAVYRGSHPAVMAQRIAAHPIHLDHNAPEWRTTLTWRERARLLGGWMIDRTTDRFTGRGDHILVGRFDEG
jgi:glycosyltransferase involved in cell wall biosynthesis